MPHWTDGGKWIATINDEPEWKYNQRVKGDFAGLSPKEIVFNECPVEPATLDEYMEELGISLGRTSRTMLTSKKENQMKVWQVFFVHKETNELQYEFVVANSTEAATMKVASLAAITADEIDDYHIKITTYFTI